MCKVNKHTLTTNEDSDGKRPPRSTVAAGSLFLPAPARRLSILGPLGRSSEAPRGQQRRGYSDRTSERSRNLVGARVVWEVKRDDKTGFAKPLNFM